LPDNERGRNRMSYLDKIDKDNLPEHVAIIMDGNGRWAKQKSRPRIYGHRHGVESVREVIEAVGDLNIPYLTLYAFSTENWSRPPIEVSALMALLVDTLRKEINSLNENNIKLNAIGDIDQLPRRSRRALLEGVEATSKNTKFNLILALNYSGRVDIENAAKKMASDCLKGTLDPNNITSETISNYLSTAPYPDPELLIRTSGELRVSNFLLWEIAYAELYFTEVLWPDFKKENFYEAICAYQSRERRFGKTSDQLVKT
jgi:undecaprenyl diphosphate synthase